MKLKRFSIFLIRSVSVILVFIFAVNAGIYAESKPYIHKNITDIEKAQTALIPGAAIFSDGRLSPVFQSRVNGAIKLYKEHRVSKILVSGDNSTIWYNEVNPVRDYLINEGIPAGDIFLDHAGFDTYSTMYRARDVFKVESIIISSQAFHLPRSVFIARNLGIRAEGFNIYNKNAGFKNYIREILANEKAFFDLLSNRKPKFLGEEIPISDEEQKNI